MSTLVITYAAVVLLCLLAGTLGGGLAAWWLLRRHLQDDEATADEQEIDPFIEASIDAAAVRWGEQQAHPEAAARLMKERLTLLHRIGSDRGWL